MPAIYKDGKWYTGDNSGHLIKDNGTDLYPREALNFTDFNVQDDSVNNETDIKPHRLTQAELAEIITKKPAPKEGYPVLFDETEAERVVGWYKYANGTKKPVYRNDYNFSSTGSSQFTHSLGINNYENLRIINATYTRNNDLITPIEPYWMDGSGATSGVPFVNLWIDPSNNNIYIRLGSYYVSDTTHISLSIEYTKTTDQPI